MVQWCEMYNTSRILKLTRQRTQRIQSLMAPSQLVMGLLLIFIPSSRCTASSVVLGDDWSLTTVPASRNTWDVLCQQRQIALRYCHHDHQEKQLDLVKLQYNTSYDKYQQLMLHPCSFNMILDLIVCMSNGFFLCVCVKHLNRCKTSNPFFHSRGVVGILGSHHSTKTLQVCCDMQSGRRLHVPAGLLGIYD